MSRTFVTEYTYDFLGSVLVVANASYDDQGNKVEPFYHHFEYDADKRLLHSFTSLDGSDKKLRASYFYYLQGPLKRIELGEKLQGIDFVYNIHGWLTQINHPDKSKDPNDDGNDVFGMVLDYYESDMAGIFQTSANFRETSEPNQFHKIPVETARPGSSSWTYQPKPAYQQDMVGNLARIKAIRSEEELRPAPPATFDHFKETTQAEVFIIPLPNRPADFESNPSKNDRVVSASAVRALYEEPVPFDVVPDDVEFSVLKNFYDSLQGAGWYVKTNWPTTWPATATSAQFGTWFGITVTNGDVTGIYFVNNGLKGLLPKSIFKLTELTSFQLYNNGNITGTIPTSMGSLSKLTTLAVSGSQLSGTIPVSLGNLSNLSILRFDYNKLSGSLPTQLGNITTLTAIILQQNTITGPIPASFNNLTNMVGLNLSLNQLTGPIPDLGNMKNLTSLNLGGNTLSGSLPSTIGNLTALKSLLLNNNLLSGTLPSELGNLTQLETLYLYTNTFTGSLPVSLGKLTKLTSLLLSANRFTGSVPESLSNLTEMVTFAVSQNTLSGEFPAAILSKWTKLVTLQLFTNAFTGSFPSSIGSCPALTTLTASGNKFTGLPQTLLSLPLLTTLDFQSNYLTTIPNLANHPNKSKLTVKLRDNLLDFSMWEPIFGATGVHGIKSLDYASQKAFPSNKIYVAEQNTLTISASSKGQNGSVIWEQKSGTTWANVNALNEDATGQTFTVSNATTSAYGTYRWTMTDVKVPSLTLQSGEFEVLSIDASTISSGLYNGLISSVSWRTDEAYLSGEEGFKGVYRYQYDDKYQIKDSRWGTPNSNWDGFADGANTFRVTGLNYDPNGNILALKRYNEDGSLTNDFQYAYDGKKNQLKSVTGYRNNYQYNLIGQMIAEDKVSGPDQFIDYDVSGKVRKIYFDAAKTVPNVEYLYDDHGFRLAKIDYQSKKTTWYVRDVTGNIVSVYEQTGSLPDAPKPVQWTTLTNITVNNLGDLNLVTGITSGTAYGNRLEAYQNGYLEYTVSDVNQPKDIGFVSATTYCFNFYDQFGLAPVRANGRAYDAPNYGIGTKFRIEKLNDKLTFYKNGVFLRQFAINPADPYTMYVILRQTTKILGKDLKFVVTSTPTTPTLRQVEVPIYGAGKLGTYYPDQDGSTAYEITDHLGNVRALLRENVNIYTATMEDNGLNDTSNPRYEESGYFENLFETEMDDPRMNHTADNATTVTEPSKSAYLYWKEGMSGQEASDKAVGPAMGLKVNPGDKVSMETWVRYEAKTENNTRDLTLAMLAQTLGASLSYQAGFEGLPLNQTTSILSTGLGTAGFFNSSAEDDQPFAYLNYILFDENNEFVDAGWQQVPLSAAFEPGHEGIPNNRSHARLTFDHPIEITKAGSIYIWVSNESEDTKVWFDDLKVTHEAAFVIKVTDYGTWGDVIREQEVAEYKYRFGYQGQFAEKDAESGWNHFELREYDPIIGRWLVPDPVRQFWSPYVAMGNNPTSLVDPTGGELEVGAVNEAG
ncbi:MAG TPA: RHS repeat-associated core domain-containing protein, partial [Chryseolinea sp.]